MRDSQQVETAANELEKPVQPIEDFGFPHERAEYDELRAEARALDDKRQRITGRLNVLRQRFMQRRLAAQRGKPFRRTWGKGPSNAD